MVQETFPFFGTSASEISKALTIPGYFDPWSKKNMNLSPAAGVPAPRTVGDSIATRAAYTSGHVFSGILDRPTIDHRQYLERELDMHNSHQSFAVRERVMQNCCNCCDRHARLCVIHVVAQNFDRMGAAKRIFLN